MSTRSGVVVPFRSNTASDVTGGPGAGVDSSADRTRGLDRAIEEGGRLLDLEAAVADLKRRPTEIPVVVLDTLAPEPYELLKPIHINVEPDDDEGYRASLVDANLTAYGETRPEAIWSLKDLIVGTFEALESVGEQKLGPGPARQYAVLCSLLRKSGG